MKKIIKIIFCLCLFLLFKNNALALTLEQVYENDVWIFRKGGNQPAFSGKFTNYYLDGKVAYCIEPGKHITTSNYEGIEGLSNLPFTEEINNKLQLIGYYGYDYPGHQTLKYKMATQALIWETVNNQVVEFWTKASGAGTFISVKNEKNEIMNLVNNHLTPNFDNYEIDALLNKEVIFTDNNNVLNNYEIINNNDAYIRDNKVYITPKNIGIIEIKLKRNTYTNNLTTLFIGDDAESQQMAYFGTLEDDYLTLKVNVKAGNIKLYKYDKETKSCNSNLYGARYNIYDENNNIIDTMIIGDNCSSTSNYFGYGKYYLKEEIPSNGYLLDNNTYTFEINNFNTKEITVYEDIIKGRIKINKLDQDTNSCQIVGDASLLNAKYEVYDSNNNLVDEIIIKDNCIGLSKYLPYGKYLVKEITPSTGYLLDNKSYNIEIKDNDSIIEIISLEKIIMTNYKIYKVLNNKSTGILEGEPNITFDFYLKSTNQLYISKTTDNNGLLEVNLPYGTYLVRQVNTTSGYAKSDDFEIAITKEEDITKIIADGENALRLKVIKVDSETNKPIRLSGFKFKIKNTDTNNYVCMTTNKVICEYITNEEGIMITPLPLSVGNYSLEETDTAGNYLLNKETINFSINDNSKYIKDEIYGNILEITFKNQVVKGNINIIKYGEVSYVENNTIKYKQELLDNIEFNLYALEDIILEDGTLKYTKDSLIKKVITNKGYATINNLYLGKYYLVETKTNEKYTLDDNKYCFELSKIDNQTKEVNINIELINYLKKGTFELLKIDSDTKEPLSNISFNIYDDNDEIIYTGVTNEEGIISVNLPYGKYTYKEIDTDSNYILDDDLYAFTIDKDLVTSVIENTRIEVPNTLSNENYLIDIIYILVGLLYEKKKYI
jgi:uncharacterized surface anchored protein